MDSTTGKWIIYNEGLFSYTTTGKLAGNLYRTKEKNGEWLNQDRMQFKYNNRDLLEEETFDVWNGNEWVPHQRIVYHYRPDSTIEYSEVYEFDHDAKKVKSVFDTRHLYSYNKEKHITERRIQYLKNGVWEDAWKRGDTWGAPQNRE